jgi:hypothetical protein
MTLPFTARQSTNRHINAASHQNTIVRLTTLEPGPTREVIPIAELSHADS